MRANGKSVTWVEGGALRRLCAALAVVVDPHRGGFLRDCATAAATCISAHDAIVRASADELSCRVVETLSAVVSGGGGGGRGAPASRGGGAARGGAAARGSALAHARVTRAPALHAVVIPVSTAVYLGSRLHVAASRARAARVSHLVACGCSLEVRDEPNTATPLLSLLRVLRDGVVAPDAALDTLATFLSLGADPRARYAGGLNPGETAMHTALAIAPSAGGADAVRLLLRACAPPPAVRAQSRPRPPLPLRPSAGSALVARRGVDAPPPREDACNTRTGATSLHVALQGGRGGGDVSADVAIYTLELVEGLLRCGSHPNAVLTEPVGTNGRTIMRRPLDVIVDRLLSAPVSVAGWPYTGSAEWVAVADALIEGGADPRLCLEETRVWLRKAGLRHC